MGLHASQCLPSCFAWFVTSWAAQWRELPVATRIPILADIEAALFGKE